MNGLSQHTPTRAGDTPSPPLPCPPRPATSGAAPRSAARVPRNPLGANAPRSGPPGTPPSAGRSGVWGTGLSWAGALALTLVVGCSRPAPPPPQPRTTPEAATASRMSTDSCEELLSSLFDMYRISKLETTFDLVAATARLNDWLRGCSPPDASPLPAPAPEVQQLFSSAQWALLTGDQFRQRDAAHLRDCLVIQSLANRIRQSAPEQGGEPALVRHAFRLINHNVLLEPRHMADLPMSAYDIVLLGRGTAADRAWIFVNTLRTLGIDALVVTPGGEADAATGPLLVGVVRERELDLFDPGRGIPLPGPGSETPEVLPATLRQLISEPGLAPPVPEGVAPPDWKQPRGWLVGDLGYYSQLSHRLQSVFGGEQAIFVSDPLQDLEGRPGLWRRLLEAADGLLKAEQLALWPYSSEQVAQSLALKDQQLDLKKASRLRFMAYLVLIPDPTNPGRMILSGSRQYRDPALAGGEGRDGDMQGFTRTETRATSGRQLEARLFHLGGEWKEAISAYVEVQSNAQEVLRIPQESVVVDLGSGPIDVKRFHVLAVDDAAYWMALCQWEQGQLKAAQSTLERYLKQARPGSQWSRQARWLLAELLANQGRHPEAAEVLSQLPDGPDSPGAEVLIKAWKR